MDYPVAIFVRSNTSSKFYDKYPNSKDGFKHWVVCYGWTGNSIRICDPASGIDGFTQVPQKYNVDFKQLSTNSDAIVY